MWPKYIIFNKCLTDSAANGNFIGTCTNIATNVDFCSGVYNIDQIYDTITNTQIKTGDCAGSIALVDVYTSSANDQPVTGGTGAYKGASGNAILTTINDPALCPLSATICYKIDFDLN